MEPPAPYLGEGLALATAATWAVSVILFKRSESVPPQGLNLFKNVVAIVLLVLTMPIMGIGIDWQRSATDWGLLAVSGLLGIAVADTLFFMALRRLGAGLLAVVECIYVPSIVVLSMAFLGEKPGPGFVLGAVLVVGGVLFATLDEKVVASAAATSERNQGIVFGLLGIAALAFGVVSAKPVLENSSLVEVTLVRMLAGVAGQLLWVAVDGRSRYALAVFRPAKVWRTLLPAAILGAYVSTLLWLGGFKYAEASVASALNQMTTVFIIILGRVFLGEPITNRRLLGASAAIGGALLILSWDLLVRLIGPLSS